MGVEARLDNLRKEARESQTKICYFILGGTGTAIGYAIHLLGKHTNLDIATYAVIASIVA